MVGKGKIDGEEIEVKICRASHFNALCSMALRSLDADRDREADMVEALSKVKRYKNKVIQIGEELADEITVHPDGELWYRDDVLQAIRAHLDAKPKETSHD